MNIFFLYRIYPSYGGVEVVTTLLANEFIKDGHKVTIASFEEGNQGILKQLENKVNLLRLPNGVFSFSNIKTVREYCKKKRIDLIINQWGLPFYTTMLLKMAMPHCKMVSVLHGSPIVAKTLLQSQRAIKESHSIIKKRIHTFILKFKTIVIKRGLKYNLKHNNKYILLSESFIPTFKEFTGLSNCPNLTAIGNPITISTNFSYFEDVKKKQILYVGRMDLDNKRVDRVISFWERNYQNLPDWELIMVGDGPYKENVLRVANKLERVSIYPFEEDPPIKYYRTASVLLLTSDLEGFGLVVIEAMSYGVVPIVYGSYEAIYDIIDNNSDGIIVEKPFNEEVFDHHVIELCNNNDLRKSLAINAAKKSKSFSMESIKKEWYSIFNNL